MVNTMGWMNNFKKKISGMPQDEVANEGYDYNNATPDYYTASEEYDPAGQAAGQSTSQPATQGGSSMELKMVSPTQFSEMPAIAKDLMNNRTIVINMENTSIDIMRRMMDFLSGVAFCIGGQIQPITKQTYIITPGNVDVSGEQYKQQLQGQAQEAPVNPAPAAAPQTPQNVPYGGFDPFGQ